MRNKNNNPTVKLRSRLLKDGTYSLYLDIYYNGKRELEYLNLYVKDDYTSPKAKKRVHPEDKVYLDVAKDITAKRTVELVSSQNGLTSTHLKQYNFIEYGNKVATTKNYKALTTSLNVFSYFAADKAYTFAQINTQLLNDFIQYLKTKEVSNNSIRQYLTCLHVVWRQAMKENIITHNPFAALDKPKAINSKREFLSLDELEKLIACPTNFNPYIRYAFLFSCHTGLRFSDIHQLQWTNIEGDYLVFRQQKSQKESLRVPLSLFAQKLLTTLQPDLTQRAGKVFDRLPHSNSLINDKLKIWQYKAGITKNLSFHIARHTFATLLLSQDVDLYTTSKLLGHSNLTTTQIYAKVIDSTKEKAISKLPDLDYLE